MMLLRTVKTRLRSILPDFSLRYYRKLKIALWDLQNSRQSPREVFSRIYKKNRWGKETKADFCSGSGSSEERVVKPYIESIIRYIQEHHPNRKPDIVDLGCGDFTLGQNFIDHCSQYQGVDIVPDLISYLQTNNFPRHVQFMCLDIIEDQLPNGEICFLRQVLQHLSNQQILNILQKLSKYRTIFITEHYPADNPGIVHNLDIVHGSGIRLQKNSAVYLDKPPFDQVSSQIELFLEVEAGKCEDGSNSGLIRTYIIKNV
jgi:hypothetical protein